MGTSDLAPFEEMTEEEIKNTKFFKNPGFDQKTKSFYEIGEMEGWTRPPVTSVDDYIENVKYIWKISPFFYDKQRIFWLWSPAQHKYMIADDTDMFRLLDKNFSFGKNILGLHQKAVYMEAFKRVGRANMPKDAPLKWIQFKEMAYSIYSKKTYAVKPNYFFTNPIPWEIGQSSDTPVMDRLITQWVGDDYVRMIYEIIAYCCLRHYPIHRIFCFVGSGRNGKSKLLEMIRRFVGDDNTCSTELHNLIKNRFESFRLYKKLVCEIGETNFNVITETNCIKNLSGEGWIGYEKKQKDPFHGKNYAKIIIASNSLPVSHDTSDGWYRRMTRIDFPNEFKEGKDILKEIPEHEYSNLAKKVTEILPKLLENGSFTNEGTVEDRKARYIDASNPIASFIDKYCIREVESSTSYNEMYLAYLRYLQSRKKRRVRKKEFKEALEDEGFYIDRKYIMNDDGNKSTRWDVFGLILKGSKH